MQNKLNTYLNHSPPENRMLTCPTGSGEAKRLIMRKGLSKKPITAWVSSVKLLE